MLKSPYNDLHKDLQKNFAEERLITDPLRTLAYGTDASFYRLIPQIVVIVETEEEVQELLSQCRSHNTPVTFRAAGTSLSGQAVTDSVLGLLGDNWNGFSLAEDHATVSLQPGVIGGQANAKLAPFGKKIGPDPASINAAKIGGIAANNASGMCCGTAQNSYRTLSAMRLILQDGTLLDTGDQTSIDLFRQSHSELLNALAGLRDEIKADPVLAGRIEKKFKIKNTTGYSLNALIDYEDPIDILQHLMIGSEGTLGFIAEVTYKTCVEHSHKASAMVYFETTQIAARAVQALKSAPVSAVELVDRAGLHSVEDKPGMPSFLKDLPEDATALLIEVRGENCGELTELIEAATQSFAHIETVQPVEFSDDPEVCARYWGIRKGLFPLVGAMRETGTSVIIEDIAFPIEHLADGLEDLHHIFKDYHYDEAIIFGHALEGNLHFVFTQDFNTESEVERYGKFMDAVCEMVVKKYDGSLKAEHGTGRNMAPFVEMEWGADAFGLMKRIKALFDPQELLNPGVIINEDKEIHVKNLKPLPASEAIVDKCIECGFCEPKCPSRHLTLTPRQRIVGWREISRREDAGENSKDLRDLYAYQGMDTCAACGLCATACPVGIETGALIKLLRGKEAGDSAGKIGQWFADHYGTAMSATSMGLKAANLAHGILGSKVMQGMSDGMRKISGERTPRWTAAMPTGISFKPEPSPATEKDVVVYIPSCASRTMGPARGDDKKTPLPVVTERLLKRAGYAVRYPEGLNKLCCGQPFDSKGLKETADHKAEELEVALLQASEGGKYPVVFDTSPCAFRMNALKGEKLKSYDMTEFMHDHVMSRLELTKIERKVAIHPTCSTQKMALDGKMKAVVQACVSEVVIPEGVGCCGWAGDKGFTTPELNAHALRKLPDSLEGVEEGYSTSRTCEIGLSEKAGFPYRSIVYLLDECTKG
ncbi:putative 4Fe-4S ferredoxin, oxidoreductase [Candidatus Terasakiella magnetica]|uniref:D-lactate dehydrogenase (cytochrome) n=1 Tax=Candidatus Terasakiella magnetica TaxID=1867952 RepID=A0A1C3RHU8_9PROT|nr:FAD-binding and (Fe-S)-binding domain-containing protein [Candidatus Terasakiella magnetica]SCA56847.1 putative 4Fe-4S ferredoxin, oxidoreductase [Candidatus Terasakiella magnetica]